MKVSDIKIWLKSVIGGVSVKDKIIIFFYGISRILQKVLPNLEFGFSEGFLVKNLDGIFFCRTKSCDMGVVSLENEKDMRKYLDIENGVFIDVGAHIGKYTVMIGNRFKENQTGKVISIEPDPGNFSSLIENIKLNNLDELVKPFNVACWSKNGRVKMFLSDDTSRHSIKIKRSSKKIEVNALRLDSIMKHLQLRCVDLIKIDAEGAEAEILTGGRTMIKRFRPRILFEAGKENLIKCRRLLRPFGYRITQINEIYHVAEPN